MKDFFSNWPTVAYSADGFSSTIANIAIGEIIVSHNVDISYVIWKHELIDDDTPISVSEQLYKTTEYYWTILYVNNVVNPYTDWYMSQTELEAYCKACYADMNALHHFERRISDTDFRQLDEVDHTITLAKYQAHQPLGESIFPVTNLLHEKRRNDTHKRIKVISPRYINDFVNNFHRAVGKK